MTTTDQREHDAREETGDPPAQPGIGPLIRPARGSMILSATLTGIGAILSIVPYIALTEMAVAWLRGDGGHPRTLAAVAVVAALAGSLLYSIGVGLTHMSEARLRHRLRMALVRTLGRIPLGRVDQTSSGAIRKMVVDDTAAIHTIVAHLAGDFTYAGVSLVVGFGYLLWVDWRLALLLLVIWILCIALAIGIALGRAGEIMRAFGVAQTRLSATTVEMVEGIEEIKNFQAADAARTRFDAARRAFTDISYDWVNGFGRGMAVVYALLHPAAVAATVAPAAYLFVRNGWLEPGYALPFFLIGIGIPQGLMQAVSLVQHLYEARMAAGATAAMLAEEPMPEGPDPEGPVPAPGEVRLEGVTFGYDPAQPVLHGVSLTAAAGEVTALVGPSGGGKTTIARLIARFHDPDSGTVRIGGLDAREVSLEWLLSNIAIVFQDVSLVHDTVAANIALGHADADRARIEEAAKAACIHERILRLPQGYDTVVGDAGGFLSGGERQRITIARAYLQDAPILVLDEATAQADPRSERAIHRALGTLARGRTVIIIAHRLATIAAADRILVVDGGRIVESGRHAELLAADGAYAALWRAQQAEPADAAPATPAPEED